MAGRDATEAGEVVPLIRAPAFVGRGREVAALAEALGARPAVVLIEGEAGAGKSRLLHEFLASPHGERLRSLVAQCPPFRVPYTLGPVVDALRAATDRIGGLRLSGLAGALRPLFPEWAAELPAAPEPLEDAGAARHRLFRAVAELLDRLHVDVLVVEDAHWADEATLEFLLFVVSAQPRLSVVVTYRPEDLLPDSLLLRLASRASPTMTRLRLSVGALDVAQTARLVSSMLGGDHVSTDFAAFLHHRTGGVPLVLEESVRLMGERADLIRRDGGWMRRRLDEIDVPPTVRDAVLERFQRLGPAARAVLQAAAVLAESTDDAVLVAVTGLPADRVASGIAEALHSGLLREDGRYRLSFRHALAARAVYEAIPRPDRRAAHLRAGRVLEVAAPRPAARLARHFRAAGETADWCRYAEQAADLALASADEATAASLLHDLLTTADLPARTVVRLADKIPAGPITGTNRCAELVGVLRSVLANEVLRPEEEGELRLLLGRLLNLMDEFAASRVEMAAAIACLPHSSLKAARAMVALSRPRNADWPAAEHLRWLRRASEVTTSMTPTERTAFAVDRVEILLMLGEDAGWALAAQIPDTPSAVQTRETTVRAHLNIGDNAMRWGHYERAWDRLDKAMELVDRDQYPRVHDKILATAVHLDWFTGRWDGLAERVHGLIANLDDPLSLQGSEMALVVGWLHAAGGDSVRATERFQQVLTEVLRRDAMEFYPEPAGALARLHLATGRVDDALSVTDGAVGMVARKGIWLWATEIAPVRVEALLAAGRVDEAADLVESFARGLGDRDVPAPRAALALCRAVLARHRGEHVHAATAFARAAAAWERLPRPYDALLARERQAACLLAAGQAEAGSALLSEVLTGLSELGARGDADRVARTLRELGTGVQRRPRLGRRGYGDQLSPRELEVVRLVATGRTNREIAEALVLSPKTVARHLDGAMRKLAVSSRTALAVKAVESGLVAEDQPDANR